MTSLRECLLVTGAADRTGLRRFHLPRIEDDDLTLSFFRLSEDHIQERSRRRVENGPVEARFLGDADAGGIKGASGRAGHVGDRQRLGDDEGVITYEPGRDLVVAVLAPVCDPPMPAGERPLRLDGRASAQPSSDR